MNKCSLIPALLALFIGLPAAELSAQSGSRSGPAVGGSPGGGAFTQRQNRQIRAGSTIQNNSIASINRADLNRGNATAQVRNSIANLGIGSSSPRAPSRARAASFGSVRNQPTTKPFSGISRGPTVSPYLGLFTETFDGDTVAFDRFVQPALQQQQIVQQVQRQQQEAQRMQRAQAQAQSAVNVRLQQLSARPAFNPSGSQVKPPTGHSTAFGNRLQYYGGR